MELDLVIEGKAVTGGGVEELQVGIVGDRIAEVRKQGLHAPKHIHAGECLVFPGFIDLHVHLREPGWEYKEDFRTGTKAAIHGGVTTVVDMPNNPTPTVSVAALEEKQTRAKQNAVADVLFYGGVAEPSMAAIEALGKGVAGFKVYLAETTGNLLLPTSALPLALAKLEHTRKPVSLHCEDQALIERARERLQDRTDPLVHCEVRAPESEVACVKSVLPLLRGMRANICHLSTAGALALIESQKRDGQQLACEVTPHHLFCTQDAMSQRGNYLKSNPPLRSEEDRQALLAALKAGRIDFLATDHAPHTREEKERDVWQAPSGVPGLDTYGNFVAWLIVTQELHPTVAAQVTSSNPAQFLGLTDRGAIAVGQRADLTILDVHRPERVSTEHLYTKCGWSPFEGVTFPGRVRWTIYKGRILQDDFEMYA